MRYSKLGTGEVPPEEIHWWHYLRRSQLMLMKSGLDTPPRELATSTALAFPRKKGWEVLFSQDFLTLLKKGFLLITNWQMSAVGNTPCSWDAGWKESARGGRLHDAFSWFPGPAGLHFSNVKYCVISQKAGCRCRNAFWMQGAVQCGEQSTGFGVRSKSQIPLYPPS